MRARARSSASDASDAFGPSASTTANSGGAAGVASAGNSSGMNDDMHLKKFKRRREDDFDIATIKRRAVSPGMSSQNSPILAQSPQYRDGVWGQPPERKKEGSTGGSGEGGLQQWRSGSTGSNASAVNGGGGSGGGGGGGTGSLASQGKKLGLRIIQALDFVAAQVGCYKVFPSSLTHTHTPSVFSFFGGTFVLFFSG